MHEYLCNKSRQPLTQKQFQNHPLNFWPFDGFSKLNCIFFLEWVRVSIQESILKNSGVIHKKNGQKSLNLSQLKGPNQNTCCLSRDAERFQTWCRHDSKSARFWLIFKIEKGKSSKLSGDISPCLHMFRHPCLSVSSFLILWRVESYQYWF